MKIFLNFNIKLRIKLLQKYVFCPYRKYFFSPYGIEILFILWIWKENWQKPFKNSQHTNTRRGHLVRPSQSSYEVVWRLYPMNLHLPCEKRPSQTFKTANIPTPGEVIWYAHHNPVTRWYEGCILSIYIDCDKNK